MVTKNHKALSWGTVLLAVVLCVGVLFAASCGKSPATKATTSANTTSSKTTKIADADGTIKVLPVVGKKGEVAPVDTTHDARTPATFNPFTHNNTPVLMWGGLVQAVNAAHATQYINAVNDRAKDTGFSWADIQKWSVDPQLRGTYTLTIQVFGSGFSDAEARNIAAELVGRKLADVLPIVPHPAGILINTRSVNGQIGDFLDVRSMVRVSLSPVIIDKKGNLVVGRNSGIFADCFNIWRLGRVVKQSAKTPGTPGKTTTPKSHHKRLAHKIAALDPWRQGHAPVGGGKNQNPGPGKYIPPSKMVTPPPTPRTNPPAPTPTTTSVPGGSTPDPQPTPTPEGSATATASGAPNPIPGS